MKLKLIVGLGNPTLEYKNTKHNVGWWFLDEICEILNLNFEYDEEVLGFIAKNKETVFLKPTTFMNDSGKSVLKAMEKFNIDSNEILVVFDDINVDIGEIKVRQNKGSTHNGIKDIMDKIKTKDFMQFKIGIEKPKENQSLLDYVLSDFSKFEETRVLIAIKATIEILIDSNFRLEEKGKQKINEI